MLKTPQPKCPSDTLIDYLRIIRSPNIGPHSFFTLLEFFHSAKAVVENLAEYSLQAGRSKPIKVCPEKEALAEMAKCQKIGAKMISYFDEEYSKLLRQIADPPPILTTLGDASLMDKSSLAIVGPRNSSFNGCKFAKKIAHELGEAGFIVVSGMARGIDSAAHQASLEKGTIAVLGGGIDNIYPPENKNLYEQIAEKGLIMSENPFGYLPIPSSFPRRNRIVSGISLGVVVIEATMKSGTLITARCAAEQGREVFAVPGSPFDPRSEGANRLITDGATLLQKVEDITANLVIPQHQLQEQQFNEPQAPDFEHFSSKPPSSDEIRDAQKLILERINYDFVSINELAGSLEIPVRIVNVAIMQLEFAEKIENFRGKICLKG